MSFNYKIREFWQFKRILSWNDPYKKKEKKKLQGQ